MINGLMTAMRLSTVMACLVHPGLAIALPEPPGRPPSPPKIQPPAPPTTDSFFGVLSKKSIKFAESVDGWRADAESASKKTVSDFAGCPSRDAQKLYDLLGARRKDAIAARDAAEAAEREATQARQRCLDAVGIPAPSCHAAYNKLPFAAQKGGAQAAADAMDAARQALKALRCPAGCDKPLHLRVVQASSKAQAQISPTLSVCTAWDPGRVLVRAGIEGDELGAEFKARLPRCTQQQTVVPRYCKDWDVGKLVPALMKLKLLPPEFTTGRITITVPTVDAPVVTGFTNVCRRTQSVCTQVKGEATVAVDTADPMATLAQISASRCAKQSQVGCAEPPLGLQPTMGKLAVPTTSNARLTWTASDRASDLQVRIPPEGYTWSATWPPVPVPVPQVKASGGRPNVLQRTGSVEFDVTKPEWKSACKQWADVSVPTSRLSFTQRTIPTGFCLVARMGPLVAKP